MCPANSATSETGLCIRSTINRLTRSRSGFSNCNSGSSAGCGWARQISAVIFLNRQSETPGPDEYAGGSLSFHGLFEGARGDSVAWDADDPEGPGASTALTFLNGRINSVAGGTDQMQRNAIGEQVLGLPREPSWERDKPFDEVLRAAQHWDGRV